MGVVEFGEIAGPVRVTILTRIEDGVSCDEDLIQ